MSIDNVADDSLQVKAAEPQEKLTWTFSAIADAFKAEHIGKKDMAVRNLHPPEGRPGLIALMHYKHLVRNFSPRLCA